VLGVWGLVWESKLIWCFFSTRFTSLKFSTVYIFLFWIFIKNALVQKPIHKTTHARLYVKYGFYQNCPALGIFLQTCPCSLMYKGNKQADVSLTILHTYTARFLSVLLILISWPSLIAQRIKPTEGVELLANLNLN
jgi:hypothetical protein